MKKTFFYLMLMFLFSAGIEGQNIITVSNVPNSGADFADMPEAIAASQAGDIILVSGSGTQYSGFSVDHPIAIYGPGYFLGQNEAPLTQATTATAKLFTAQFNSHSVGSIISGCQINGNLYVASDMIVKRNEIRNGIYTSFSQPTSNVTISQNHVSVNGAFANINANGWVFENNVFETNSTIIGYNGTNNYTFRNNVFNLQTTATSHEYLLRNATVTNNIFIANGVDVNFEILDVSIATNNIFIGEGDALSISTGNLNVASVEEVFVGPELETGVSTDAWYQLQNDSPAIGFGTGGVDCGVFGGANPYVLSGIPEIPNIFSLDVPSSAAASDGLKIQIKAKANN